MSNGTQQVHIETSTFSASSSDSFDNVFSADYDFYRILTQFKPDSASSNIDIGFRLRVGGVDNSTASSYRYQYVRANSTTVTGATALGNTLLIGEGHGSSGSNISLDIFNPFLAVPTNMNILNMSSRLNMLSYLWTANHNQSVSYDGFTIIWSGAATSGTISIFGYAKA